ncbi:family 43 glycosylhydrolase [Paenibacillus sp. OV219]|uniref:family 43 glycosylhydrolase n=1 Tax=Paenibacillus sp. OV219 TaxID=1884377 RepID=UPI0008D0EAA9|nr:family 43 glycosylhydrolase [Paenibacillus sp. OV219]SEN99719.1 Glycosyl hydrolases family 32 N-terminal domain-containing protein [Paenibacillus sp. OV219]
MNKNASIEAAVTAERGGGPINLDWGAVQALAVSIDIDGQAEGELAAITSAESGVRIRFYTGFSNEIKALSLIAELYTDARKTPLVLSAPWDRLGSSKHSVHLQNLGYAVRLFVDGVLVDEDWPMGAIDLHDATIQLYNDAEQLRIWNEAIQPEALATPQIESLILGEEPAALQYWRPKGFNTSVGDCMPFFDGENFRVYYLFDRRGHASKWSLGAHQWAQVSTKDLRTWEHHPIAVGITAEEEGSICTGSVFVKDGIYYAFYAVRATDGSPAQLTWAESSDGIHFDKTNTSIRISDRYLLSSVRDPHVYQDKEGKYHMLVTTSLVHPIKHQGCLAHLVSDNLTDWEELEPFIVPGYHDEPECADFFEWNGWYYLIFSNDGLARYRYSHNPEGPWLRPAMDTLDCVQWRVPKTAAYHGGRRIAAGFLSSPGRYGGELVFREVIQQTDGSLGLGFVPELREETKSVRTYDDITLDAMSGFDARTIGSFDGDYIVSFEVTVNYPNMYFGFSVADSANFEQGHGYDVRFEPTDRKAGIHKIHARSLQANEDSSIYQVGGLTEKIAIKAIVKDGWIDLCVGGERTLISRTNGRNSSLRFFVQFGSAQFERICVKEI